MLNPGVRVSRVSTSADCRLHQQYQSLCLNLAQLAAKHKNTSSPKKANSALGKGRKVDSGNYFVTSFLCPIKIPNLSSFLPQGGALNSRQDVNKTPGHRGRRHIMESTPAKCQGHNQPGLQRQVGMRVRGAGLFCNGQTAQ